MKIYFNKIIFILFLCISFPLYAYTASEWNARFAELNPGVPLNVKWGADGQKAYLMQLWQSKPAFYKNPDNYPRVSVTPSPVVVAPIPKVDTAPVTPVVEVSPIDSELYKLIKRIRVDIKELEILTR